MRWEPERLDEFRKLVERGLTRDEIAAEMRINWRMAQLAAREYGLRMAKRKRAPIAYVWKPERLEAVRRLASEGKAAKEIAEHFGVDQATIRSVARYNAIELPRVYRSWKGETLAAVLRRVRDGETIAAIAADLGVNAASLQSTLQQRGLVGMSFAERRARLAARHHAIEHRDGIERHREALRELQRTAARREELDPLSRAVDRYLRAVAAENREDVRQDAIVAVLEGATLDRDLVERCRARYAPRREEISLDEPAFGDGRRLVHEIIADPRAFDPSD